MREIKFRAWNIKEKRMQQGFYIDDEGFLVQPIIDGDTIEMIQQEGYIIMQFTGLKDSKGVEIYEGDIVRYIVDTISIPSEEVVITTKVVQSEYGWYPMTDEMYCYHEAREVEVIGNIYEP